MINIGDIAFSGCNLTSVHISDMESWCKIHFLGQYANPLCNAHHLFIDDKEITDVVIPSGVTSINDYAFIHCYGLTSVTIPYGVKSIGEKAFYYCNNLTSVSLSNSLTSISRYAFA